MNQGPGSTGCFGVTPHNTDHFAVDKPLVANAFLVVQRSWLECPKGRPRCSSRIIPSHLRGKRKPATSATYSHVHVISDTSTNSTSSSNSWHANTDWEQHATGRWFYWLPDRGASVICAWQAFILDHRSGLPGGIKATDKAFQESKYSISTKEGWVRHPHPGKRAVLSGLPTLPPVHSGWHRNWGDTPAS